MGAEAKWRGTNVPRYMERVNRGGDMKLWNRALSALRALVWDDDGLVVWAVILVLILVIALVALPWFEGRSTTREAELGAARLESGMLP